jgi:hypothetical protein
MLRIQKANTALPPTDGLQRQPTPVVTKTDPYEFFNTQAHYRL